MSINTVLDAVYKKHNCCTKDGQQTYLTAANFLQICIYRIDSKKRI